MIKVRPANRAIYRFAVITLLTCLSMSIAACANTGAVQAASPMNRDMSAWSAAETINIWPGNTPSSGFTPQELPDDYPPIFIRNVDTPKLHVFEPEVPNGRALLVLPGGSYVFTSISNEGLDIAEQMTPRGYTVFVLTYRLPDEGWDNRSDVALEDAQRAMRVIRNRASEYQLNSDEVFAIGFSAGGHLGASLATGFDETLHAPIDKVDDIDPRPTALALVYPVISHAPGVGHAESTAKLLGPNPSDELIQKR